MPFCDERLVTTSTVDEREAEDQVESSDLPLCRRSHQTRQQCKPRPKSTFYPQLNPPHPVIRVEEPFNRSCSLSYKPPEQGKSVAEMAEELLDSLIELRHKRAVVIFMDPSDLSDADKLQDMLTSCHSKTPDAPFIGLQPGHIDKVVEVMQQLSRGNPALVEAVIAAPLKRSSHKRQEKLKTHEQIKAVLFEELKRKVMRALLMRGKGSATHTYPLSVFIKAQNSLLCRDLVSLFLMGANSLYLFIYNWKGEPVLVNTSAGPVVYQHHEEILKWIHTIGSTASTVTHPSPAVSAMVVVTNFEELVNKSAGEHRTAKKLGHASTHKLCEQLQGHPCATILESKPILLNLVKESKGHSCESEEADVLMEKLADSNFPSESVDPRWVHLLCEICGPNHHPALQMEGYLELARSAKLGEKEALSALSFFREARLVFFLPRSSQSELKNMVFTNMEWLVNTLNNLLTPPSFSDMGRLWDDWKLLRTTGIMSEAIKTSIEQCAMTNIVPTGIEIKLPSQWVFMLLREVNLFTHIPTDRFFCPLYLSDEQDSMDEANQEAYSNCTIPPLYLRPNSGCVTDQYTMRLFCYIISSGILSLQECLSRTHAIFLYREHNLRFTISCSMGCLKIEVESSFSGRALDDKYASDIAQELVSTIVRASEEMRETWYPVLLTKETGKHIVQHPNQFFQCCDDQCSHYRRRTAPGMHLSRVVYSPKCPYMECELSGQRRDISVQELFWISKSYIQVRSVIMEGDIVSLMIMLFHMQENETQAPKAVSPQKGATSKRYET